MKISPINRAVFKGWEINFPSQNGEERLKTVAGFYKNSSIEKTLGSHHSQIRNRVYFASPMEFVPDRIKDRVDFVVYDNEPSYPEIEDVRKNYLENNRTDYRKQFEEVREYYYRREMGGHADVNEAKYQQWQAAECTRIYDRAGDLRFKKESAEDEIKAFHSEKKSLQAGIASTIKELEAQKEMSQSIQEHIKNLEELEKPFNEIKELSAKGVMNENILYAASASRTEKAVNKTLMQKELENTAYYNEGREAFPYDSLKYRKFEDTTSTYSSIHNSEMDSYKLANKDKSAQKQLNNIRKTIANFKTIAEENTKTIADMQNYINELKTKLSGIEYKIESRTDYIKTCKSRLQTMFDELANFYKKQGIKIIKK